MGSNNHRNSHHGNYYSSFLLLSLPLSFFEYSSSFRNRFCCPTNQKNAKSSQTENIDKDERFMATSDLMNELEAFEGKVDAALQTQIRDAIIKELDDKSADVQTIAVSWCGFHV
jgi:hypothetical protein